LRAASSPPCSNDNDDDDDEEEEEDDSEEEGGGASKKKGGKAPKSGPLVSMPDTLALVGAMVACSQGVLERPYFL
jgi:hypothetical protein